MAAVQERLDLHAGDDKELIVTITDNAGATLDLTGYKLRWVLADSDTGPVRVRKVSEAVEQIEILNQTTNRGKCKVFIVPADTAKLAPRQMYHELDVIDTANKKSTVLFGTVTLRASRV
jgi:hypothetical protein